jgi:hypothetical protein
LAKEGSRFHQKSGNRIGIRKSVFNDVEITNSSLFNCFNNYVSKFCFQSLVH